MSNWLHNRVPTAVALLGGFGLGTTLTYFFGMYLALVHGGFPGWTAFFVDWAPLLMMVPAVSLVAYMFVRSRVGGWLVDNGAFEAAVRFTSERLRVGWLRSEREAWRHRRAAARAEIGRGNLERADELLRMADDDQERAAVDRPDWFAWAMETAARRDADADDGGIEVTLDRIEELALDAGDRAAARMWAVAAEMVARDQLKLDEGPSPRQLIGRARDRIEDWSRVDVAEAVVLTLTSGDREDWERAETLLESARGEVQREIPTRRAELAALRAELFARMDDRKAAAGVLRDVDVDEADTVSRRQVARVKERYGFS